MVAMERRSDVHLATSSSSKLSRVLLSSFYPPISPPSDHPECLVPSHHLVTGPKSLRSLSSSLSLRLAAVRSDLHPKLPSWQRLDQLPAGLCGRVC